MAWENSNRKARLPPNWDQLREAVLRRDNYKCKWWLLTDEGGKTFCGAPANQADHKIAGDDHSMGNLQALCEPHHARKSSREGGQAAGKRRAEIRKRFRREPEVHPGYLAGR